MRSSEIKIKRREVMSTREVADLLRHWANQIDAESIVTLDAIPIPLANVVFVRQDYKKEGRDHSLTLKLHWEDSDVDQSMAEEPEDLDEDDLDIMPTPGETDLPTPLEMQSSPEAQRANES
ncbi:hypothetical protein JJB07_08445 [Tumebacillus sp. ITR2]|uniref:Amphi-Trp domain-containing protein n=1 Tax=Tumebacillus amylolyticus TaxID=2801339 RepID=A0ABS1J8T8_9BACL|nr:hypothetical protein [Tumebacillus amylolyticus]MBL0386679.1 hypothetical protein [Tumebacillus amylolyticus]